MCFSGIRRENSCSTDEESPSLFPSFTSEPGPSPRCDLRPREPAARPDVRPKERYPRPDVRPKEPTVRPPQKRYRPKRSREQQAENTPPNSYQAGQGVTEGTAGQNCKSEVESRSFPDTFDVPTEDFQEHKRLLDSVTVDPSFLSSPSVRAVEFNLRDDVTGGAEDLILSAIRAIFVRTQEYPKAAELLGYLIDSDLKEENVVKKFRDLCITSGSFENLPFFRQNVSTSHNQTGRHASTTQDQDNGDSSGNPETHGASAAVASTPTVGVFHTGTLDLTSQELHQLNTSTGSDVLPFNPIASSENRSISAADDSVVNASGADREHIPTQHESGTNDNHSETTESGQEAESNREDFSTKQMSRREWRARLFSLLQRERKYLQARVTCSVCGSRPAEVTFLPCSHLTSCSMCATAVKECPQCGKTVLAEAKTFLM